MIIYLSMILWVLLMRAGSIHALPQSSLYNGVRYYKVSKTISFLTMAYIVFWVGMRTGYIDTGAYISAFQQTVPDLSQIPEILISRAKGQAWQAMAMLFKSLISNDAQAWLMFHAAIAGFAVAGCYRRYSEAFFFCLLIFLLSGNCTWMMNGIRQFFCVAVIMMATPWLIKGKTFHYMLLIAALSFVHFSVLIMAPIYFVVRQSPWGKMTLLAILGTATVCALASEFGRLIEDTLESTSYSGTTLIHKDDDGVHPLRVVVAATHALLALSMRRRLLAENNTILNIGINMSILAALLFAFGVFTSGIIVGRLPIYCTVYAPITLTLLFNRIKSSSLRKIIVGTCLLGYVTLFILLYYDSLYYVSDITGFMPGTL